MVEVQDPAADLGPPIDLPANSDPDAIAAPAVPDRPAKRPYHRRRRPRPKLAKKPTTLPSRISFLITDDGKIDLSRTTDENIRQLRGALGAPEALRRLGLVDADGEPTEARTWAHLTMALIDSVNALAVQAAANTWKLTDDQAAVLFLRRKPEMHGQVSALTGELLDKYFPGGFGAYDKEITLLVLLTSFTLESMQTINAMKAAPARPVVVDWDGARRAVAPESDGGA
jgi:hypothetical protein